MRSAGLPFLPDIFHRSALEAHKRHQTPQVYVHFLIFEQFLQRPCGDQPVIRVVVHHLGTKPGENLIVALCGEALEGRVFTPILPHTVHNVAPGVILLQHAVDGVEIVLPVAVDGDGDVTPVGSLGESRQQGVLMTTVAA